MSNEQLRELLREARDSLNDGLEDGGALEAEFSRRDRLLIERIDAALAEPDSVTLPKEWRVMNCTSTLPRSGDRWEIYGQNGGGVVHTDDVTDWVVREFLDELAAYHAQQEVKP